MDSSTRESGFLLASCFFRPSGVDSSEDFLVFVVFVVAEHRLWGRRGEGSVEN